MLGDRPGSAALARRLADAGVSLEILVPSGMGGARIEMAIGGGDPAAIRAALGS